LIRLLSSKGYAGNCNTRVAFQSSQKKLPQAQSRKEWIQGKDPLSICLHSGERIVASRERQNPWQLFLRDWQGRKLILFKQSIAWIAPNRERDKSIEPTSLQYRKELLPKGMTYQKVPAKEMSAPLVPQEAKKPSVQIIQKKRRHIDPKQIP